MNLDQCRALPISHYLSSQRAPAFAPDIITGFVDIDALIGGGINKGEVVLVASQPCMGKTTLMANILYDQPLDVCPQTLYISKDGEGGYFASRLTSIHSAVKGYLYPRALLEIPILIIEHLSISINQIWKSTLSLLAKKKLDLIIIDELENIYNPGSTADELKNTENLTLQLKNLAMSTNTGVIVLTAIKRKESAQSDFRLTPHDIRRSVGDLLAFDKVITLYRDEVYKENSPDSGLMEVAVLKNSSRVDRGVVLVEFNARTGLIQTFGRSRH